MLHALVARRCADRFIDRIAGPASERLQIGTPEPGDRILAQQHFAGGEQLEFPQLADRALGLGVKGAQGFYLIAEQVDPHRIVRPRRKQVDHAAAHRKIAGLDHCAGAGIAVGLQEPRQLRQVDHAAWFRGEAGLAHHFARRHALGHRIHGRHNDQRPVAVLAARQPGQSRGALGGDLRRWRNPVIGKAIPGGQAQHRNIRRKESAGGIERRCTRIVARNKNRKPAAPPRQLTENLRVHAFRRAANRQAAGRRRSLAEIRFIHVRTGRASSA